MTGQQTRVNGSSTLEMGSSNQELLSGGKKGKVTIVLIGVILLIALGVLVFIVFRGSHFEPKTSPFTSSIRSIDLLEMLEGHYTPQRFNGTWVSDEEIIYKDEEDNVILYNVNKNDKKVIVEHLSSTIQQTAFSYELSADKKYLLVGHSYQKLYRHSFLAYYDIINLQTKTIIPLTDPNNSPRKVQLVVWAPVGNALAYVFMNDIYYWPSIDLRVQEIRITKNGRTNTIHNGVTDWVYEEEVFSSNTAMWFSKDGSQLAFATFNDTTTPVMSIPYYGLAGNFNFQYTQTVNIRYPKPGRPNPEVTLSVVDLKSLNLQIESPHTFYIPPPSELAKMDPILSVVAWASHSDLVAIWMNRVQNKAHATLCSTNNDSCKIVMSAAEPRGWVELFDTPLFSKDGKNMVLIYTSDQGNNAGNYRHIVQVDLTSTSFKNPVPLTQGKFEISDLLKWDEAGHEIYFLSNTENSTSQLRVNKVSDNIENAPHQPVCVSCRILTSDGKKCLYSGGSFSQAGSYFASTCAGPDVPEVRIFHKSGKEIIPWEKNDALKEIMSEVTLPITKEFRVPIADGFEAVVKLHLPPNLDTSGDTKYPMLIQVYAGPDSNLVSERFLIDWHSYLAVNQSVIVGNIDARNSGLRGDKIRFAGYRNLGTVEVEDTILVTSYLQDKFNYIDKNRTAIWGWSYGGYTTVMALANDTKGVFKCGISVAPVTDWLYYDSIYTERFMGLPTPDDNLVGYKNAAIFNNFKNLRNKDYFLVHGTLDDNVHYQQSMMLAKVLEENDILFRQQNYPDEEHSLAGVRPHLYHSLEQFLKQCFQLK